MTTAAGLRREPSTRPMRAAAADRCPVARLYEDHGRAVFNVALRLLGRADLAEDATQETMVRVWRAADRIDPSLPIKPWLMTIARRVAIDMARYERRRSVLPLHEANVATGRHDEGDRVVTTIAVRAAVASLGPDAAALVWLHCYQGLSYPEIAVREDVPIGTVKSRSFEIRRRLARVLDDA